MAPPSKCTHTRGEFIYYHYHTARTGRGNERRTSNSSRPQQQQQQRPTSRARLSAASFLGAELLLRRRRRHSGQDFSRQLPLARPEAPRPLLNYDDFPLAIHSASQSDGGPLVRAPRAHRQRSARDQSRDQSHQRLIKTKAGTRAPETASTPMINLCRRDSSRARGEPVGGETHLTCAGPAVSLAGK